MGVYRTVSRNKSVSLSRTFPMLRKYDGLDRSIGFWRISVFDRFLDIEEARELLDKVSAPERARRDVLWCTFHRRLIESTLCYGVKWVRPGKPKFLEPQSEEKLLKRLCVTEPRGILAIPEWQCVYEMYWDDTNLLYFKKADQVQPILHLAEECGLYVLT